MIQEAETGIVTRDTDTALSPTPGQLLQIAIDKDADLDKLEKLMELQERWEAKEAKKAFYQAMSDFRNECPVIDKAAAVDFTSSKGRTNYAYAALSDTIEQIKPLLHKYGLSYSWKTSQDNGNVEVMCCLRHSAGHEETTSLFATPDATGNKNSVQAIASTVTYLERYTLFAILGLSSKEMDDDGGDKAECITQEMALDLEAKIQEVGGDLQLFLKGFGIGSMIDLPLDQLSRAANAIEKKRQS